MNVKNLKKMTALMVALIWVVSLLGCTAQQADEHTANPQQAESPAQEPVVSQEQSTVEREPVLKEINHYTMRNDETYFLTAQDQEYVKVLLEGVLNRAEFVALSKDYDANLRVLIAATENPYWFFVQKETFNKDHTGVYLTYQYGAEEQAQMLDFMDQEYLTILNSIITPEMNDTDKALAVHHYFGQRITYDYDWLDAMNMSDEKYLFPDIVVYEALKTGRGVCHTYSYLCEFALRQLGVECIRFMDDLNGNENDGHMWLLVKLDGTYYHMDTTWDSNGSDMVGLAHFGMTDEERQNDGFDLNLYTMDSSYHGISCSDSRFQILRDVQDYEYLGNHRWKLYTDSGTEAVYHSDTGLRTES